MELKDQVCTLEQAKRLKELGLDSESLFYHIDNRVPHIGYEGIKPRANLTSVKQTGKVQDGGAIKYYAAYTASELGEMLPCESGIIGWEVYYNDHIGEYNCIIRDLVKWKGGKVPPPIAYESEGDTIVEAMADALIHCLENKLVTPHS